MARSKTSTTPPPPTKNPSLILPRSEVSKKLQERIIQGLEIQSSEINSRNDLDQAQNKQTKWDSYNTEYLKRCFDTEFIANQYARVSSWGALFMNPSLGQLINSFKEGIQNQITELESLLERLELIPEAPVNNAIEIQTIDNNVGKSVFIVHGHDDLIKTNVARFIEKLGLNAIILHEQPNKGQTIIEKFESNASNVGFAVILLTSDDIGASKNNPSDGKARARQNVVLELGYFCGALGRSRVCVLYENEVELPSDYLGVLYIPLDGSDSWQLQLAKEMKEANIDIDLNKAL